MQHIETVTVGAGGAASITFSAIPDTFTDLLIVHSLRSNRTNAATDNVAMSINGQGFGVNISSKILYGTGAAADPGTFNVAAGGLISTSGSTSNVFGNGKIYIPNYTNGSFIKSISTEAASETNATDGYQALVASVWNQTAAITSISIKPNEGTLLLEFSSASLYGITAGSDGLVSVS